MTLTELERIRVEALQPDERVVEAEERRRTKQELHTLSLAK